MTEYNNSHGQAGENETKEKKYKVIFTGEIKYDSVLPDVKQKIARLFKINLPGVETIFAQAPRILKSNLSLESAYKYKIAFEKTGALCKLEEMDIPPTPVKPQSPAQDKKPSPPPAVPESQPEAETIPTLHPTPPPWERPFSPKQIPPTGDLTPSPDVQPPPGQKPDSLNAQAPPLKLKPDPPPMPEPPPIDYDVEKLSQRGSAPPEKIGPFTPEPPPAIDPSAVEEKIPPLELDFPEEKTDPGHGKIPTPPAPPPPPSETASAEIPTPPTPGVIPPQAGQRTTAVPGVTPQVKIPEIKRESPMKRFLPFILIIVILIVAMVFIFRPGSAPPADETQPGTPDIQESPTTREADLPETSNILTAQVETFTDPNGFYSLSLPEGYTKADESTWDTSKISFSYPDRVSVSITARAINKEWNAEEEMKKKVKEIEGGKAGTLSLYQVIGYKVLSISDAQGYDLTLQRTGILSHYYYLVDTGKHAVSITLITEGVNRQEKHNHMTETIEESLEIY